MGIASSSSSTTETIYLCRSVLFFSLSWVWSKMRSVRKIRYYTGFSGQGIFVFVSLAWRQKPGVLKNPFLVSFSNLVILFEPKCVVFWHHLWTFWTLTTNKTMSMFSFDLMVHILLLWSFSCFLVTPKENNYFPSVSLKPFSYDWLGKENKCVDASFKIKRTCDDM